MSDDRADGGVVSIPGSNGVWLALAVAVGLLASYFHWIGLLVGGVLVGLSVRSTGRALLFGAGFGLLVWGLFVGELLVSGVDPTLEAAQLWGLSLVIPVVLGTIGASASELRPLFESGAAERSDRRR